MLFHVSVTVVDEKAHQGGRNADAYRELAEHVAAADAFHIIYQPARALALVDYRHGRDGARALGHAARDPGWDLGQRPLESEVGADCREVYLGGLLAGMYRLVLQLVKKRGIEAYAPQPKLNAVARQEAAVGHESVDHGRVVLPALLAHVERRVAAFAPLVERELVAAGSERGEDGDKRLRVGGVHGIVERAAGLHTDLDIARYGRAADEAEEGIGRGEVPYARLLVGKVERAVDLPRSLVVDDNGHLGHVAVHIALHGELYIVVSGLGVDMERRPLGACLPVAEVPEVASGVARRKVCELDAALQLVIRELGVKAVLDGFLHVDGPAAHGYGRLRPVGGVHHAVGERHRVAPPHGGGVGDGHRHVEHLAVVAVESVGAKQREAVVVVAESRYLQLMARSPACQGHAPGIDGEACGELQVDDHADDGDRILKVNRIGYRLPAHAVLGHPVDVDIVGRRFRGVGRIVGVVIISVIGHER